MVFEMHDLESEWRNEILNVQSTIRFLQHRKLPVVTLKKYDFLPSSIVFPLEEMHIQYFECSISYMLAYAIYKGATAIDVYGVNLIDEYIVQKANVEYWVGYARGKGIIVNVNAPTQICKNYSGLYGYNMLEEDHAERQSTKV